MALVVARYGRHAELKGTPGYSAAAEAQLGSSCLFSLSLFGDFGIICHGFALVSPSA